MTPRAASQQQSQAPEPWASCSPFLRSRGGYRDPGQSPAVPLTSSWPSSVQAWSLKCLMLMAVMTCPFRRESQEQWGKMISL